MRRIVPLLVGLALASPAAAQMSTPGSAGSGAVNPFGTSLAGQITGFGDSAPGLAAVSGPAVSSGVASSPINTAGLPITMRPGGLNLVQPSTGTPGVEFASAPVATAANGAGGAGAGTAATATRKATVFAGGIGPRRFGVR